MLPWHFSPSSVGPLLPEDAPDSLRLGVATPISLALLVDEQAIDKGAITFNQSCGKKGAKQQLSQAHL